MTGPSQTRPDWCWETGQVALNVAATNTDPVEILIAESDGTPLKNVPGSRGFFYPTWSTDGTQLIVMNSSSGADPQPCTSLISPDGTSVQPNLDGKDAGGVAMYAGFASPTPSNATLIAYAGQPKLSGWGDATQSGYNQNYNYVFVNAQGNGVFTSTPLEAGASISAYDAPYQGRAPVWSPDGNYLVFESDRNGGYAIFLANVAAGSAPVQVTDAGYAAQHAKFFPDGSKLILTALQVKGGIGPRGIAWVDISGYL